MQTILTFLATWANYWLIFSPLTNSVPRSFSAWQLSSHSSHCIVMAQVKDLSFSIVKCHAIVLGPSTQPIHISLKNIPNLKLINSPDWFGIICKLTEGALIPRSLIKMLQKNDPSTELWGNSKSDQPPTVLNSIYYEPEPSPEKCTCPSHELASFSRERENLSLKMLLCVCIYINGCSCFRTPKQN